MSEERTKTITGRRADRAREEPSRSVARDVQEIRERLARSDARLDGLYSNTDEIRLELRTLAKLIRGNGEHGLVAEVDVHRERIENLRRQWRWMLWGMVTLVVAVVEAWVLR